MTFVEKIAKALGLELEQADEEKLLEAIEARPNPLAPVIKALELDEDVDAEKIVEAIGSIKSDGDISLEDRAKAEGKRVVADSDYETLKAHAAAGHDAAKELKQTKFDSAFDKALDELRVDAKPETKDRFQKLYDAAPDVCLEQLAEAPKLASAEGRGTGKGPKDAPAGVDADAHELDQEVQTYMEEHDVADYAVALDRVLTKREKAAAAT